MRAQHRAATKKPCGVAILTYPVGWRCGALRALEGSLPGTVADCVRTLRSAAVAVTGDHGERYCSLVHTRSFPREGYAASSMICR